MVLSFIQRNKEKRKKEKERWKITHVASIDIHIPSPFTIFTENYIHLARAISVSNQPNTLVFFFFHFFFLFLNLLRNNFIDE